MQAGNEAAAIDLLAARCTVAEADDVGAVLFQAAFEGDSLGVIGEGDVTGVAVAVVSHQYGEDAAGLEHIGTVRQRRRIPLVGVVSENGK